MTDAAIEALTTEKSDLYTREGDLVHVVANERTDANSNDKTPAFTQGEPRIYTLGAPGLTERLARVARWSKTDFPADPPPPVVASVLARRRWPTLRPLAGVIEAPTMRPDGSLIIMAGYDVSTRMLYCPSEDWPDMPEHPTIDDAYNAGRSLYEAFEDFPWENESGCYVAIAALLTLIARTAIDGCIPIFIFDANSPASGKTLIADTIATIATGREAGRHSYPSDPRGTNEEVNKALCTYALGGARLICWDNLSPENVFGGPALETVSTARDTASFRLLGKNDATAQIKVPWRTVMLATGNNVAITRDLERRSLVPRFVSRWESADQRPLDTFMHPERHGRLVQWARGVRRELVIAALTILRAYHLAGRPSQELRWASFEEWTAFIPSAIVWAGGNNPLACRPADTGRHSVEKEALRIVLRDWEKIDPTGKGITVASLMQTLWPERRPGEAPRGLDACSELREAFEGLAPPRGGFPPEKLRLAKALSKVRQVVIGGRSLESVGGGSRPLAWMLNK